MPPIQAPIALQVGQERSTIPPRMDLHKFGVEYALAPRILQILEAYSVTGPHTLRHLTDAQLEEAGLNAGQTADVRDAQDRWQEAWERQGLLEQEKIMAQKPVS